MVMVDGIKLALSTAIFFVFDSSGIQVNNSPRYLVDCSDHRQCREETNTPSFSTTIGASTSYLLDHDPSRIQVNNSARYWVDCLDCSSSHKNPDVPYKPVEYIVHTRKCQAYAGADVVGICETLRDEAGHIMEFTQPTCCPCGTGPYRRAPLSCGGGFDRLMKGKRNTAHCVRFGDDWFHVFSIRSPSISYSIRIEVKNGSKVSEVRLSPEIRTVTSDDNFSKISIIEDNSYTKKVLSFENMYLVIPKQEGGLGQPLDISRSMLIDKFLFGPECNKIGVSYEAFKMEPNFCSMENMSCLHHQLWNYWERDQNRINNNLSTSYWVDGIIERINQHPNSGKYWFSIGISKVWATSLLIELRADDININMSETHEANQRSPGKITSVSKKIGVSTITTKNTGEVEASYSLTFHCSRGLTHTEEHYFILKPEESSVRSFKVNSTTDQAAKCTCSAILKDSNFSEVDRAEIQFSAMATDSEIGNGT